MERREAIAAVGRQGAALFAAALALALTGCGAGQEAQTSRTETAISGVNANAGNLALRDLQVDYGDTGSYLEGGQAPLRVWIANDSDEPVVLESVTSPNAEAVTFSSEFVTETPGEGEASPGEGDESPGEGDQTGEGEESPGEGSETGEGETSPGPGAEGQAPPGPGAEDDESPDAGGEGPTGDATATEDGGESPEDEGEATAPEIVGAREFTIEIPAGDYVRLTPDTGSFLLLEGLEADLVLGSTVELEFTFSNGEVVAVEIPMGIPEDSGERSYFEDPHEPAAE